MSQAGGKLPSLTLISHQFPASLIKRTSCQIVACIQSGLALAKARVIEGSELYKFCWLARHSVLRPVAH